MREILAWYLSVILLLLHCDLRKFSNMKTYLYSFMLISVLLLNAFSVEDEATNKQLNDAMAERAVLMVESHKIQEKLDKAWADKNYTSPEIEKLRDRYQKLKFEMIEVREKIRAEVKKNPEISKMEQDVLIMQAKQKDLEKKIQTLQK